MFKQQKGVATSILLLSDVLADLSENDKKLLEDPVFRIKRPASFAGNSSCDNLPLLSRDVDGDYISRFDYHNVETESTQHSQALESFKKSVLDQNKWISLYLEPGQAVTFDNQKTLHTRNGFKANFDGNDRWLLRVFGLYNKPTAAMLLSPECNHHLKTV